MTPSGFVEETARVVAVEGRWAWVEAERQSACGQCAARAGCGTAALGKVLGRKVNRVRALNPIGARPGERVAVGVRGTFLVRASVLLYGLPLLAMLALPLAVSALWGVGEGGQILAALAGLAWGLLWVRRRSRRQDAAWQAVILRRLDGPESSVPVIFHDNKIGEHHG